MEPSPKSPEVALPRVEGLVLDWNQLTTDQMSVVKRAAGLLAQMSIEPTTSPSRRGPAFLPTIDPKRTNRVLFIDGRRGSGKSSVLISLIDAYAELIRDPASTGALGYREVISREQFIVPIGLLDLDPLPGVSNLLLQILTCFSPVVEAVSGREPLGPPSQSILQSRANPPLLQHWQHLREMAARTWLNQRSTSSAGKDIYAFVHEEVETADERARLGAAFTTFMDSLCEEYVREYRTPRPPLFVIGIDDVDMNPVLSRDLLGCVRAFRHSRLSYLLTGDIDLLKRRIASAMEEAVEGEQRPGIRSRPRQTFELQLADDIIRKVIPAAQRLEIRALDVTERLTILPGLRSELEKIIIQSGRGQSDRDNLLARIAKYDRPQGAAFLPERLRELWDFEASLKAAPGKSKLLAGIGLLAESWRNLARRAANLEALRVVNATTEGTLLLDMSEVRIIAINRLRPKYRVDAFRTAQLSIVGEYRAQISKQTLPASMGALLFIIADIVSADESLGIGAESWMRAGQSAPGTHATISIDAFERWVECEWPAIQCPSMQKQQAFARRWEKIVAALVYPGGVAHDEVLRAFFNLNLEDASETGPNEAPSATPSWRTLGQRVAQILSGEAHYGTQEVLGWVTEFALVYVSPELCLDENGARAFMEELKRIRGWNSLARMAIAARLRWYATPASESIDPDYLAGRMRDLKPSHPWWQLVEPHAQENPEKVRILRRIGDRVERAPLPFAKSQFGHDRLSLSTYITEPRRRLFLQSSTASLSRSIAAVEELSTVSKWQGSAMHYIIALWRVLSRNEDLSQDEGTSGWLTLREGALQLAPKARESLTNARTFLSHAQTVRDSESRLGPVDVGRTPDPSTRLIPFVSPGAEAVLRMAWDYESDSTNLAESGGDAPTTQWVHCRYNTELGALYPWFVPSWPQLWAWEMYCVAWNDILDSDKRVLMSTNANIPADALAFSLIRNTGAWAHMMGGEHSLEWTWESDLVAFARSAAATMNTPREGLSRYQRLHLDWLRWLILYATPEAGLSTQVAAQFIEILSAPTLRALGLSESTTNRHRLAIHSLRRSIHSYESNADAILALIDRKNENHPWIKSFGKHAQPK